MKVPVPASYLSLELGLKVKDLVTVHNFRDLKVTFPGEIKEILNSADIIDYHNFFKLLVDGRWVTVDATWDKPMKKLGFPVNEDWNGKSDMKVCVIAKEILEVENPIEFKKQRINQLPKSTREKRKLFLEKLTLWLEMLRRNNEI